MQATGAGVASEGRQDVEHAVAQLAERLPALPMVGVGLLQRQGYFHQRLDSAGWQHEYWIDTAYDALPAVLVTGPDARPLSVELTIRGRSLRIRGWRIDVGRVPPPWGPPSPRDR